MLQIRLTNEWLSFEAKTLLILFVGQAPPLDTRTRWQSLQRSQNQAEFEGPLRCKGREGRQGQGRKGEGKRKGGKEEGRGRRKGGKDGREGEKQGRQGRKSGGWPSSFTPYSSCAPTWQRGQQSKNTVHRRSIIALPWKQFVSVR